VLCDSPHVCVLDALLQWVRFNGGIGSLQTISEIDLHHGGTQKLLTYLLTSFHACLRVLLMMPVLRRNPNSFIS
jgi:hypothetical protein